MSADLTGDEAQELVDQFSREHSYTKARDLMRFIRPTVESIVAARVAEAWDEGYAEGVIGATNGSEASLPNPYRAPSTDTTDEGPAQ